MIASTIISDATAVGGQLHRGTSTFSYSVQEIARYFCLRCLSFGVIRFPHGQVVVMYNLSVVLLYL